MRVEQATNRRHRSTSFRTNSNCSSCGCRTTKASPLSYTWPTKKICSVRHDRRASPSSQHSRACEHCLRKEVFFRQPTSPKCPRIFASSPTTNPNNRIHFSIRKKRSFALHFFHYS